ncbi:eRF1 domain 2 [Leptospira hartskeerlii]|uniref:ERF1 domain 2 n=1 Tax=Leptospira hartskeerlii TaxID=2023177 RepID=A0A2M9XDA8_9LEPT|nr:eRF1 domain 2 [Leptospira hartskeerlii]PJZ25678.1 eRF1 domain 2 [Leptospira hartskeerlii]PJZ35499.1 eRF1 domain 2 [Leptospira hartskeerlii]
MSYSILSIDKSMAKEFVFKKDLSSSSIILHHAKPEKHDTHLDRIDGIKSEDLKHFFEDVVSNLTTVESILLAGPGMAKTQFKNHLEAHHSALAKRIIGEITTDHPTDAELIALGKKYFQTHKFKH